MSQQDEQTYLDTVERWMLEHPFRDGDTGTSSAVFQAKVAAKALKDASFEEVALKREIEKGDAANPFLYIFYGLSESPPISLPGEHIGVIYASVMASLARGETASLDVDEDEPQTLGMNGAIEVSWGDRDTPTVFQFTAKSDTIRLGAYVKDTTVFAPRTSVEIGIGLETLFVAPVDIECDDLTLLADRVIAENRSEPKSAVTLRANNFMGTTMSVPITWNDVKLSAIWPGANSHPWSSFAAEPFDGLVDDPQLDEALRRFRQFMVAFRSHGKGGLARSMHKIESGRMTKGAGQAVLNLMLSEQVVTQDRAIYRLDPDRLAELTEATYVDLREHNFSPKTIEFVRRALLQ